MIQSPFQQASSLVIGSVDYVAPDEITVAVDIDAPESIALNAGSPRPFPRVNGYLVHLCGRWNLGGPGRVDDDQTISPFQRGAE